MNKLLTDLTVATATVSTIALVIDPLLNVISLASSTKQLVTSFPLTLSSKWVFIQAVTGYGWETSIGAT